MARVPKKTADLKALRDDYDQKRSLYESFCHEIKAQLVELLLQENITLVFPIEDRVKPWSSIVDKCQRNNLTPHTLRDINDIAGLRIIVLFQRDQEKACDIISNNFQVLSKENTADRLAEDQFGYGSVHFEIQPKEEWLSVPTLSKLEGLRAEIQVRTAAQHIW
ncbi:MAG: RelA/SpoT domain-containing protein, partial [Planctomycetes bacterium]|nr:RelA/SpoT domain-containing protein [Planctomycetota bacterium]